MKLKESIGEDWFNKLKPFIQSEDFKIIQQKLQTELNVLNSTLVPSIEKVFNPFKFCRIKDLKVVILNDKPVEKNADGLPFSCDLESSEEADREAKAFYDGIEGDIHNGFNLIIDYNLKRVAEQGVLMLNLSMTQVYKNEKWITHMGLWESFLDYVIKTILAENTGLVFILVGKVVRDKYSSDILKSANYLLTTTHPRDAVHFAMNWDANGVFEITNKILNLNNKTTILW